VPGGGGNFVLPEGKWNEFLETLLLEIPEKQHYKNCDKFISGIIAHRYFKHTLHSHTRDAQFY
jgi:hypothetical protein